MNRRHFLHTGVAVGGILLGLSRANAQVVGINDAINKSGRQRMLSQRLAKSYLQIGQNIDLMQSKKIFGNSMMLFERQLTELEAFAPTPDNKTVLNDLGKTWSSYKTILTAGSPNQRDAKSIMKINEDVLALAQTATVQLEKVSGHCCRTPGEYFRPPAHAVATDGEILSSLQLGRGVAGCVNESGQGA